MKKYFHYIYVVVMLSLTVVACASLTKPTPAQAVYAAKQDYAVALTAAVAYKHLPLCGNGIKICSDPKVVVQLEKASDSASALLDGAEVTVRAGGGNVQMAITAATQAVAALTSITQTLEK